MGRQKSAFKRKFNARWIRWRASRALVDAAPALKRSLNFYGAGVALEDVADAHVFTDALTIERPLRPDQERFIQERCGDNDGTFEPAYWRAPWVFRDEHFRLSGAWLLGHTGRMVDRDLRGVVTGWGEPENWNRDRIRLLRNGAPVEAVAVPVRTYTSYFHFLMDVALPLTAYFESGAATARPHALVSIRNDRAFVRETLRAIAARYGVALREVSAGEKVWCEEAVGFRRTSPCSDWFLTRQETAAALRSLLLAHLQPPPLAGGAERLFLRRGRERLRNLRNAPPLDALAAERGYTAFEPAAENFGEQILRAQAAQDILAVHGAALANLVFASPGARLVEIFTSDFCKSVYIALSHMMAVEHHAVLGGAGDALQNFEVDPMEVAAALRS